jgi:acyl dehydratase
MSDAPPLIRGSTYEEMTVGSRFRTASRTVTETDLVNFITLFGFNEPLFWDASHAASAGYEGRLCPGALTYAMAEGLVIQTHVLHGTGLAFMGMQLDVKRPVLVGDTIHAVVEVLESRPASKGSRGIVTTRVSVYNQRDEEVLVYVPVRLIRGKDYAA